MITFIDGAETKVVSDGPCHLESVIVGKGTATTIEIYNNPLSAVADDLIARLNIEVDQGIGDWPFNISLGKGLTVVTGGDSDVSIIYYTRDVDGGRP